MGKRPVPPQLTPIKPKQVLNPKGNNQYTKPNALKAAINKMLLEGEEEKLNALLKDQYNRAIEGDSQAVKVVLEHGFGRPSQSIEHSVDPVNPLTFTGKELSDDVVAKLASVLKKAKDD